MKKMMHSLQTKLTLAFVLLILVSALLTFFNTYSATKSALKDQMKEQLVSVASVIASGIDGDKLVSLREGQENTKAFAEIRKALNKAMKSYPDIKYVYSYAVKEGKVNFIVDASYGEDEDAAAIGEIYDEETPEMLQGIASKRADKDFSPDKWGTFLSGYAPVLNSKGKPVAAIGVDMLAQRVIEKQDFIGYTIYVVIGLCIVVAGLIILYFSATIIRDIEKLNKMAELVSTGEIDKDVDVKRDDEIGELAESFQRMIMSLRIVRMYPEDKGEKK